MVYPTNLCLCCFIAFTDDDNIWFVANDTNVRHFFTRTSNTMSSDNLDFSDIDIDGYPFMLLYIKSDLHGSEALEENERILLESHDLLKSIASTPSSPTTKSRSRARHSNDEDSSVISLYKAAKKKKGNTTNSFKLHKKMKTTK